MRRLVVLVEGLPDDAAVWETPKGKWTRENELQALSIELLDMLRREQFSLQTGKQHPAEPVRVPRPWDDEPKTPARQPGKKREITTDSDEIAAFFKRWL